MNNWLRPSMQIPRNIAKGVKILFTPITYPLEIIKEYWETWHKVYDPEGKDDAK